MDVDIATPSLLSQPAVKSPDIFSGHVLPVRLSDAPVHHRGIDADAVEHEGQLALSVGGVAEAVHLDGT